MSKGPPINAKLLVDRVAVSLDFPITDYDYNGRPCETFRLLIQGPNGMAQAHLTTVAAVEALAAMLSNSAAVVREQNA